MPRDGDEIGKVERRTRRERATSGTKPKRRSLSRANIGAAETPVRRKGANHGAKPRLHPSPSANTEIGGVAASGRGDHGSGETQLFPRSPANARSEIDGQIADLQKKRKFCIKSQSRCDRSIESLIASALGYRADMDELKGKKVFALAKRIRLAVEKGDADLSWANDRAMSVMMSLLPFITMSAESRRIWDPERKKIEKEMANLVALLPAWLQFGQNVNGLGLVGTAIICGEAGIPIGEYRTVSGLWKRMGVGTIDGGRQRKKTDKDEAKRHGYSPGRRAELWAVCSDSLFRHQWRGDKDEDGNDPKISEKPVAVPAHAIGLYGEIYAARRAFTAHRVEETVGLDKKDPEKWTKGRCHNDARRIMTKALLKDMWIACSGARDTSLSQAPPEAS